MEYQLSHGQIGLSPTTLNSSDNTATLIRSIYLINLVKGRSPCFGSNISNCPALVYTNQSLSLGLLALLLILTCWPIIQKVHDHTLNLVVLSLLIWLLVQDLFH
uniref:Uncharacterized protein n=1 Tax=Tremella fuciformis TaxID=64657 RepID=A0A2H4QCC7_9TREE|nr:hypothetical protein [Tremella fuciformis]ATX62070.1 hypothetical protein [Tremella fuciformis]